MIIKKLYEWIKNTLKSWPNLLTLHKTGGIIFLVTNNITVIIHINESFYDWILQKLFQSIHPSQVS